MTPSFALPLAETAPITQWPDTIDSVVVVLWLLLAFGIPAFGYVLMVIDFRRYLRSLRRALVVIGSFGSRRMPSWGMSQRPPCMETFDLDLPCTEEQVLAAYRQRVKEFHPDRGGDLQQFLRLQKHFEQAMHLARSHEKIRTVSVE